MDESFQNTLLLAGQGKPAGRKWAVPAAAEVRDLPGLSPKRAEAVRLWVSLTSAKLSATGAGESGMGCS